MHTPKELTEKFRKTLDSYKRLFDQHQQAELEHCRCTKVVQGRCRRCQRVEGLHGQMLMLLRSLATEFETRDDAK